MLTSILVESLDYKYCSGFYLALSIWAEEWLCENGTFVSIRGTSAGVDRGGLGPESGAVTPLLPLVLRHCSIHSNLWKFLWQLYFDISLSISSQLLITNYYHHHFPKKLFIFYVKTHICLFHVNQYLQFSNVSYLYDKGNALINLHSIIIIIVIIKLM